MNNKLAVAILAFASFGWAGTITLNLPTTSTTYCTVSGTTLSGPAIYCNPWTVTLSSLPTIAAVEYLLDGAELQAVIRMAPYSYDWDNYYAGNGAHTMTAIALAVDNTVLATSSPVSFSVENFQPQATSPTTDITVTTGEVAQIIPASNFATVSSVVSFTGSGAITPVGADHVAASGVVTFTATAGNMIACFARWQTNTATAAVTDTKGNTWNAATLSSRSGFSGQWFYTTGGIAAGSTTITVTTTPTQTVVATQCKELNGASTTSPLDVNFVANSSNGAALTSPVFTLASPAAQEFIMFGATWTGTSTATAAPGYTLVTQDSSQSTATEYIAPPSGVFSNEGFSVTVNGPNSGISKTFQINVDGCELLAQASGTQTTTGCNPTLAPTSSATQTMILNTVLFANGAHNVVLSVTGGNCTGCTNGAWSMMGQWEQVQTFQNGSAAAQLTVTPRDTNLCVTPTTNCPSSTTFTAAIINADGTAGSASSITWVVNYAAVNGYFPSPSQPITLSTASGTSTVATVVAGMQNNATSITATAVTTTGTFTRTVWVNIPPDAVGAFVPHFNAAGQILASGPTSTDVWGSSAFNSGGLGINPFGVGGVTTITSSVNWPARYGPKYNVPFKYLENGIFPPGASESAYDTEINNYLAPIAGYQTSYGLGSVWIGDSIFKGTGQMFSIVYGPGPSYSTPPLNYFFNTAASSGIKSLNIVLGDEVSSTFPATPYAGIATSGIFVGTNNFVSVDCTVSPAKVNVSTGWGGLIGSSTFIITGSGDSSLDYNGTSAAYIATSVSGGYTFPRPSGCTTLHNAASNPNMLMEPLVAYTATADALTNGMNATNSCPGGGGGGTSIGPCPEYLHYDAIWKWDQKYLAVTNPPAYTAPVQAGAGTIANSWWTGKLTAGGQKAGNFFNFYWSPQSSTYVADKINLTDLINAQGNGIRANKQWIDLGGPIISEASGVVLDYLDQGVPISVASCATDTSLGYAVTTITFSQPHLLYNVLDNNTRLSILGSTHCDGFYYVVSSPTATTITVTQATQGSNLQATGGTATYDDGNTTPLSIISPPASPSNAPSGFAANLTCPNSWKNERGHYFTVAGSSQAVYNSNFTGYFLRTTVDACQSSGNASAGYFQWVPQLTASTGGTAKIIRDLWYRRGDNWFTGNSESGPRYMFASHLGSLIWGASGVRVYQEVPDPQLQDLTLGNSNNSQIGGAIAGVQKFNQTNGNCNDSSCPQAGIDPNADYAVTYAAWTAHVNASLMAQRLIPYAFGQRLPSPDYGKFYEAAAWTSSRGQLLDIQSFADASKTLVANLSAYLVGGQSIYRICSEWNAIKAVTTITAGTTTDSYSYAPGENCAYLFPNNAAAEIQFPSISVRLADVANATAVLVQFSYSQHVFLPGSSQSKTLYQTVNAGTGSNFQLPFDLGIGTSGNRYYRLIYVDVNGKVLATGDVQTL